MAVQGEAQRFGPAIAYGADGGASEGPGLLADLGADARIGLGVYGRSDRNK